MSESQFNKAVETVQSLPKDGPVKPTQEDQLFFYMHYKQATLGDVNIPRPGLLDFTGKAKWDAWKSVEGKSKEDCWKEYVEKLIKLFEEAGEKAQAEEIKAA
ncbi:acyl-CoA-binding protein [Amanita rubescens]|nr:acyl-CoA-binding protein [Amanita rubescens]